MAVAQSDPAFRQAFRERFIRPRRNALRAVIEEAVLPRKISANNLDDAVIALHGGLWYRLLLDEELNSSLAMQPVTMVFHGRAAQ
jgi:hypothetical protein